MARTNKKMPAATEVYLTDLGRIRGTGGAMGGALAALADITFDIYLNEDAFWRNVPAAVWTYRLGGYQVLKKWLSYRERDILGRGLKPEEVQYFADAARRIGAILLLNRRILGYPRRL